MRILHISTRLILGGSQENTVLSCEGQARRGHDVHLAFGPIYGPEGSLLERVQNFKTQGRGITTHVVPHLVRPIHPWADWRCSHELKRLIRDIRPDIVHTHSSKAGILGRAAAWSVYQQSRNGADRTSDTTSPAKALGTDDAPAPTPSHRPGPAVIHTVHGPPFHKYQSSLLYQLYVASERYAARRCHLIVSVADAMTRQYLAEEIGRPEQYVTVHSGMETEAFLNAAPGQTRIEVRSSLGIAPNDFVIGTVARLAELKGHDDLLDALGDDLKKRPDWKLLWVGDGWWRRRLLARVRGMGLEKQVITTGLVPPQAVPGMIRAMDVLAHPSYREGLPRTVPQALLCGVPPVAYDVDGTGEICRDMETGRLVAPGDRPGLRQAIIWLYDHPDDRRAMAERGLGECRQTFSAECMVAGLEAVYRRALDLG